MFKAAVDADKASADYVLTAFHAARKAGLSVVECYCAGVAAYSRNHPDQRRYAAERAAAIILAFRWSALLRQYRAEWDRGGASKKRGSPKHPATAPSRAKGPE
jgi:hypothetical protein